MSYITCAIQSPHQSKFQLNPYVLEEYEARCKTDEKTTAASYCVLQHPNPQLPKSCAMLQRNNQTAVTMSPQCMADLRSTFDMKKDVPGNKDPLFEQAVVCRTRLSGTHKTYCGVNEVTYEDVEKAVGSNCKLCCTTIVGDEMKENKKKESVTGQKSENKNETDKRNPVFPWHHYS